MHEVFKKRRATKIIIWLLIIAGLLAIGYFLLQKEKTFSFIFGPGFDSLVVGSFKNVLKEKTTGLKTEVDKNLEKVIQRGESLVSQSVQSAEKILVNIVKDGLEKTKKTTGEILGVNNDSNLFVEYFSYLTKINKPLSFMLRNPFSPKESKELNYQIDWGDNQKDGGELQAGQNIIISHAWQKEGEYLTKFKITAAESDIFDYQIKVLVIK
jgi:hypothetical protein